MSWRIEAANPFALMRELPDVWAQTCFLRAPRDLPASHLLAILDDIHRVVRDDGTLWLALPCRGADRHVLGLVEALGWRRPASSRAYASALGGGTVTLFAKRPEFHFEPRLSLIGGARRAEYPCSARGQGRDRLAALRAPRRAWCVPARGDVPARAIEWCILASSSPRACGICGTAWKRLPAGHGRRDRWRPACPHINDRGRCLVLEPFCGLGPVGEIAVRLQRNYLGIEHDPRVAERARRRLCRARPGAQR
ncbi:MAG TPA: hypothetical protein VK655_02065 [Solirubrobacteraceae bacterium]|jgi:hypothetical protein|nr:hypothetical protein [Solirubrobacteraceae bacterium]